MSVKAPEGYASNKCGNCGRLLGKHRLEGRKFVIKGKRGRPTCSGYQKMRLPA